jgi:hypothetical protein
MLEMFKSKPKPKDDGEDEGPSQEPGS